MAKQKNDKKDKKNKKSKQDKQQAARAQAAAAAKPKMSRKEFESELEKLQVELVKLQEWV